MTPVLLIIFVITIVAVVYLLFMVNELTLKYEELEKKESNTAKNVNGLKTSVTNTSRNLPSFDESVVERLANKVAAIDTSLKSMQRIVLNNRTVLEMVDPRYSMNEFERRFSNVVRGVNDAHSDVGKLGDMVGANKSNITKNTSNIRSLQNSFDQLKINRTTV